MAKTSGRAGQANPGWPEIALALWGGSLGFVVGAALAAWLLKTLGGWPPTENYLRRYLNQ